MYFLMGDVLKLGWYLEIQISRYSHLVQHGSLMNLAFLMKITNNSILTGSCIQSVHHIVM